MNNVQATKHEAQIIKLSVLDQLSSGRVDVCFFYQYQIDPKTLVFGLQQTLNDFPLFAGTIEYIDNDFCLNCNNNGISFSDVQHDCTIEEVLQQIYIDNTSHQNLVDSIDKRTFIGNLVPVLRIKANYFKNDGMCLGISWHHAVGDVLTLQYFMKAFSNIIAGKNNAEKPLIVKDRDQYLHEHLKDNNNSYPGIRSVTPPELAKINRYFSNEFQIKQHFYFSQDELRTMKQAFIDKNGNALSTNDVLCGHMLAIITECDDPKIRNRYFNVGVEFRSRTGLPESLLGNVMGNISIYCQGQQTSMSIAKQIRNSLNDFATKSMNYFATYRFVKQAEIFCFFWEHLYPLSANCRNLTVTNWCKANMHDINFGKEAPFLILPNIQFNSPWLINITPGFLNHGLIFKTSLPSGIAKKMTSQDMLEKIHKYRNKLDVFPELTTKLGWLL